MAAMCSEKDASYEAGYRDGENSLIFDISLKFEDGEPGAASTMDELLEFFRTITRDRDLQWPGT
jgi:hypothetical protein